MTAMRPKLGNFSAPAFNQSSQGLGRGDGNVKARRTTKDRARDRVEFGRIAAVYVFLHGTAGSGGQFEDSSNGFFCVNHGAFGGSYRADFVDAGFELPAPLGAGENFANGNSHGSGRERNGSEEHELTPQEGGLAVDEPIREADLLKLFQRALQQ